MLGRASTLRHVPSGRRRSADARPGRDLVGPTVVGEGPKITAGCVAVGLPAGSLSRPCRVVRPRKPPGCADGMSAVGAPVARARGAGGAVVDPARLAALITIAAPAGRGEGGAVFTPNVDHVDRQRRPARAPPTAAPASPSPTGCHWSGAPPARRPPAWRAPDPTFAPLMKLAADQGWRVYLLGAAEGVASRAAEVLRSQHPSLNVVGAEGPRIDMTEPMDARTELLERVREARPDLVVVALGNPKQELWIDEVREALSPAVLIAVGAALDFVAGVVRRAPP